MKKQFITLFTILLCSNVNASLIFNDHASFYSKYENSIGIIDFSINPKINPAYSVGNTDYFQGESWVSGISFETRSFSNMNLIWQAVGRNRTTGGNIYAAQENGNLPAPIFSDATIVIQQYRPQSILAIYSSSGFYGWVPELNTDNENDGLFVLPLGATISRVEYGFSAAPAPVVEIPEPSTYLLLLLGFSALCISRFKAKI